LHFQLWSIKLLFSIALQAGLIGESLTSFRVFGMRKK